MTTSLAVEDIKAQFEQEWARDQFARLAETPCDVGAQTLNPYWEIIRLLPRETDPFLLSERWALDWSGYQRNTPPRKTLTQHFAWSIPSPADLLWMLGILAGRGVVEIGAGSGYWAWQLRQLGVEVTAVDNGEWNLEWTQSWTLVEPGNTRTAAAHPDKALMLIWPPYDSPMAAAALDAYAGELLIYAGEGSGGCTGDDAFHWRLMRDWEEIDTAPHHATYAGIHCYLTAYRRTGSPE